MARGRSVLGDWMTRESWVGVSGLAGVVGVVVVAVDLVLDRGSALLGVLAVGFVVLAVTSVAVSARRHSYQRLIMIDDYRLDAPGYYQQLAQVIQQAKHDIYLAGGGFHGRDEQSRDFGLDLNHATRSALDAGATLHRIQTSERVDRDWALGIARMMDVHPDRMRVYRGGAGESALAEVAIFDPDERDCVAAIQVKSEHPYGPGWDARVAGTIFLYGNRDLARGLHRLFAQRLKAIPRMTADEVRALATEDGQEPEG